MPIDAAKYDELIHELGSRAMLIAVSKSKPAEDIMHLYNAGHRDFGENYVQELLDKYKALPKDIRWHFIGHLQSNKVKSIVPFVSLIHGVDSFSLLKEIDKQGKKCSRVIDCLLQVHISEEQTKFGMDEAELSALVSQMGTMQPRHINVKGFMGIASLTGDAGRIRNEFTCLKRLFEKYTGSTVPGFQPSVLSMGMSADYKIAVEEGSNMVRIGSLIFGERNYAR